MRYGIVVFPGTWSEVDCYYAVSDVLEYEAEYIWHRETPDLLGRFDCIILPGGFSYGDYLRAGALARFSAVMSSIRTFADHGGLVLGICNGFQVLCEAGLLPGALVRNRHLSYRCQWTALRVENNDSAFTSILHQGMVIRIPISHGEGCYFADETTLRSLEAGRQVAFRYSTDNGEVTPIANPNGSATNIAGITNAAGNVLGMMPHPERACEELLGGADGALLFKSIARATSIR